MAGSRSREAVRGVQVVPVVVACLFLGFVWFELVLLAGVEAPRPGREEAGPGQLRRERRARRAPNVLEDAVEVAVIRDEAKEADDVGGLLGRADGRADTRPEFSPQRQPAGLQKTADSARSEREEAGWWEGENLAPWEKGVVRPSELSARRRRAARRPAPQIVQAFRHGQVDWHDLIPKHSSVWERFGESEDARFNFMKLVLKETKVTDFLTQYDASGARVYGGDSGPLENYSSTCNVVRDVCAVHSHASCLGDSFCEWHPFRPRKNSGACRSVVEPAPLSSSKKKPAGCATVKTLSAKGLAHEEPNASACQYWVTEPAAVIDVEEDASNMFYHWWRFFKVVFGKIRHLTGERRTQILIANPGTNTQFYHYFGLIADACWRRLPAELPPNTCFCGDVVGVGKKVGRGQQRAQGREATDKQLLEYLLEFLDLDTQPVPTRVRIGLISRRRKRFLLNEHELVDAALELGFDVQILPLEDMTLYEQIAALRATTVLVGIHGSGLNNAIFLRPGAALIQLLPYKLNYKGAFATEARRAGASYLEWAATDRSKSVFHWEFLGDRELHDGRDAYLERGSPPGGPEVYTFWINQDIVVPVAEFKDLLQKAVAASELNARILKLPHSPKATTSSSSSSTSFHSLPASDSGGGAFSRVSGGPPPFPHRMHHPPPPRHLKDRS